MCHAFQMRIIVTSDEVLGGNELQSRCVAISHHFEGSFSLTFLFFFSFKIIGFFLLCEMVNDVGIFMFYFALYNFKSNMIRYVSLLFATKLLPL